MAWLDSLIPPKMKKLIGGSDKVDGALWTKCVCCDGMVYARDLRDNLMVCGFCGDHFQMSYADRLRLLFDDEKFGIIQSKKIADDPLRFRDLRKYTDRLKESRQKTGLHDSSVIADGEISGIRSIVFVMDFSFMGGSMGLHVGKSFIKAVSSAVEIGAPLVSVTASGGARMQEGMLSLVQMPATVAALCSLKEAKIPFINVFTHPTTGGVLASFSMLGDINIAEPGALIGFAGVKVIENTIKQKLPNGFQRSEFLLKHGMVDMIVHRRDMKSRIGSILRYLTKN